MFIGNTYLIIRFFCSQRFLLKNHPGPKDRHERTMAEVTEHNSEQERKRNDGIRGGVHFPVRSYTIRIVERLKSRSKLVRVIVSWRIFRRVHSI